MVVKECVAELQRAGIATQAIAPFLQMGDL